MTEVTAPEWWDVVPADGGTLTTEQVRRMVGVAPVHGLRDWKIEFDRWLAAEIQKARTEAETRLYDVKAYLAKTLDNIEGIESGWTAAEAHEFITDALAMAGVSSQEPQTGQRDRVTVTIDGRTYSGEVDAHGAFEIDLTGFLPDTLPLKGRDMSIRRHPPTAGTPS